MRGLLLRLTKAREGELEAVLAAFTLFFSLLAGYYVLRPLRDEMAVQVGSESLQDLFDAVFVTMLTAVPAFGWLVRRFPRRRLLPWIYAFFAANLVGFYAVMTTAEVQRVLVAKTFFVWVTVFSATGVSVFWSLMADLFTTAQATRVYGFVAAGGTAGALLGPALTLGSVHLLGPHRLLLVAASLIGAAGAATVWLRRAAERAKERDSHERESEPSRGLREDADDLAPPAETERLSSSVWSGLRDVARSPLLLGICAFLLLYSLLSTLLYFDTTGLLRQRIASSAERTALLAKVDGAVSLLALVLQLWVFPRFVARAGLRAVLVAIPLLSVVGFAVVAARPLLSTIMLFGMLRRSGEFALSKPAREMLFNALTPDEKYKAKNVIDTLVFRTGDELSSRLFGLLRSLGVATHQLAWIGVPLSVLWTWTAYWLGHPQRVLRSGAAARPPRTDVGS